MTDLTRIDTTFDMMRDSNGKDPDLASPTLRRYHRLLWSRPLPDGTIFTLEEDPRGYLHHSSEKGDFALASDVIATSMRKRRGVDALHSQLSAGERYRFDRGTSTIGAYILFPATRVDGKMTINGARGMTPSIADRFDLTLEAIRRHYAGEDSPLAEVLSRYTDFFALFETFEQYVSFFLLDDLVDPATGGLRFFHPFEGFDRSPIPTAVEDYRLFRARASAFLAGRTRRVEALTGKSRPVTAAVRTAGRLIAPRARRLRGDVVGRSHDNPSDIPSAPLVHKCGVAGPDLGKPGSPLGLDYLVERPVLACHGFLD